MVYRGNISQWRSINAGVHELICRIIEVYQFGVIEVYQCGVIEVYESKSDQNSDLTRKKCTESTIASYYSYHVVKKAVRWSLLTAVSESLICPE